MFQNIPLPNTNIKFQAGPSKQHILWNNDSEKLEITQKIYESSQMNHRSQYAKDLISMASNCIFDLFNITLPLRNVEFKSLKDTKDGWHVVYTSSGSDGMARAIRATCDITGNFLVNTDNFSKVAFSEMKSFGRESDIMNFDRGKGLVPGSQEFEQIVEKIINNEIKTLYLTLNGTTTGVEQYFAMCELVGIRNESNSGTVIIADIVSAQMFGRDWDHFLLPDVMFWGNQKDLAITSGTGNMIFNNRALSRSFELSKKGLDTGGKLGIEDAYGKNEKRMASCGQTAQTPSMGEIFKQILVYNHVLLNPSERKRIKDYQDEAKSIIEKECTNGKMAEKGFTLLADPKLRTLTSHVIKVPKGICAKDIVKKVANNGYDIATGYGTFKDDEIRICCYSANSIEEVREVISIINSQ